MRGFCRLTKLSLFSIRHCTAVDLRGMLAALPLLHSLHLVDLVSVRSLDCLSAAPSLTELRLQVEDRHWLFPSNELQSLHSLPHLQRLELTGVVQLSDAECVVYHQWPNALWPRLVAFSYTAATL